MKKIKHFLLVLSALILGCIATSMPISVLAEVKSDFQGIYAAKPKDSEFMIYGSSAVHIYTEAEATAAGIPEGYENEVLKVEYYSGSSCGVFFDFSEEKIPLEIVESLSVRVYIGVSSSNSGVYPQIRIVRPNKQTDWVYRSTSEATPTGEWVTVVIPSTNFNWIAEEGFLNKFELGLRSNAQVDFYIDSLVINTSLNDGLAPVITYDGDDTITTNEGANFDLGATAYDEQEKRNVQVQYVWGEGTQFADDGTLKMGTWSLTLVAEDYYGNKSEKALVVVVKEEDKTAPVIDTMITQIYATVGTIPRFSIEATDDSGSVTVKAQWSEGALDRKGRLMEGTHSYTITATDPSGNTTTHTITGLVTKEEILGDVVIDEDSEWEKALTAFVEAVLDQLDSEYAKYKEEEYTKENYALIKEAYDIAKIAIENERRPENVTKHLTLFTSTASGVEKLSASDSGQSSDANDSGGATEKLNRGCGGMLTGSSGIIVLIGLAIYASMKKKKE